VNAAPLTASITGSQNYGGGSKVFNASYATFVNGDTSAIVTGTLTCSTNAVNGSAVGAGYTTSGCSGVTAPNYTITFSYGAFTVNAAPLTATITGSQTFGGANKVFNASYSPF